MILIKVKRGGSNGCELNNLIQDTKLVIGDNHRFAPFYWAQITNIHNKYDLIHIDFHYDDVMMNIDTFVKSIGDPTKMTIMEFLCNRVPPPIDFCSVSYDNIISFFTNYNKNYVKLYINENAINKDSKLPFVEESISTIPDFLKNYNNKSVISILDIDFDFFANSSWIKSNSYIRAFFDSIKSNIDNYDIITIALSPSTTKGGWVKVDEILSILNEVFQTSYSF